MQGVTGEGVDFAVRVGDLGRPMLDAREHRKLDPVDPGIGAPSAPSTSVLSPRTATQRPASSPSGSNSPPLPRPADRRSGVPWGQSQRLVPGVDRHGADVGKRGLDAGEPGPVSRVRVTLWDRP